jgi:hypothetical protein
VRCNGQRLQTHGVAPAKSPLLTLTRARERRACLGTLSTPHPGRWQALRSNDNARPASAPKTEALSPSRGSLIREPGFPMQSGARSGRRRRSSGCAACRSMTSTRSCHGRLANLTRSVCRYGCRRYASCLRSALKPVLDGKLAREAARERDRERMLGELIRAFEEDAARRA